MSDEELFKSIYEAKSQYSYIPPKLNIGRAEIDKLPKCLTEMRSSQPTEKDFDALAKFCREHPEISSCWQWEEPTH